MLQVLSDHLIKDIIGIIQQYTRYDEIKVILKSYYILIKLLFFIL